MSRECSSFFFTFTTDRNPNANANPNPNESEFELSCYNVINHIKPCWQILFNYSAQVPDFIENVGYRESGWLVHKKS